MLEETVGKQLPRIERTMTREKNRSARGLSPEERDGPAIVRRVWLAVLSVTVLFVSGTTGWVLIEEQSALEGLYATFQIVSTLGYGDRAPKTVAGEVLVMVLLITGFLVLAWIAAEILIYVIHGHLTQEVRRLKIAKRIRKMEKHVIVCGLGRVGSEVIRELRHGSSDFVAIDPDEELLERELLLNEPRVVGDSTEDAVLQKAGIERASGLVICGPNDAANVFTTLSAKGLNPNLHVIARASVESSQNKLLRAGADRVVIPSYIGGRRMATMVLRPGLVDFVDLTFSINGEEEPLQVEELTLDEGSPYIGKSLRESNIKTETEVMIVALRNSQGNVTINPPSGWTFALGDALVCLGRSGSITQLRGLASPHHRAAPPSATS